MAFLKTGTEPATLITLKSEPDRFYIKGAVKGTDVELLAYLLKIIL